MSAVLLAVFNDYEAAERMRVTLFRDGFPTDRVHLTCAVSWAAPASSQPLRRTPSASSTFEHY